MSQLHFTSCCGVASGRHPVLSGLRRSWPPSRTT